MTTLSRELDPSLVSKPLPDGFCFFIDDLSPGFDVFPAITPRNLHGTIRFHKYKNELCASQDSLDDTPQKRR